MSKNNLDDSNSKSGARGGRRAAKPERQTSARGKRIRVDAARRERVDPDMIALCYWLLAQRIVQDAGDDRGAAERPDNANADRSDQPDRAPAGADS